MRLYHLATAADANTILSSGFSDGAGTYKATGVELAGIFFSADLIDSNEDRPGSIVLVIELPDDVLEPYEIIEAQSDHRSYNIPASIANSVPRSRLSSAKASSIPVVDRRTDPAFPHET